MLRHRTIVFFLHFTVITALTLLPGITDGAETNTNTTTDFQQPILEPPRKLKPPPIPVIRSFPNHMDNIHDRAYLRLQRPVNSLDNFFAKNKNEKLQIPMSRFRLGTYLMVKEENDQVSTRVEPDFEADLNLPNIEHRFGLFINSFRSEDLPGVDPTERRSSISLGLQNVWESLHLHSSIGARWRGEPVGIAKTEWRPKYSIGKTTIYPRQKIFYETDNGYGEITSLILNRWFGKNFARLVSAGKWTEQTAGVEWEQTFMLGHVIKLIEEKANTDIVANDDVARGFGIRYSIFGQNSTAKHVIDRHRLTLTYRHPLYRNWLFFQVAPGIEWKEDSEWAPIPSIQFGIDTLFWELAKP